MNYYFLLSSFFPNPDATTIAVVNIAKHISKKSNCFFVYPSNHRIFCLSYDDFVSKKFPNGDKYSSPKGLSVFLESVFVKEAFPIHDKKCKLLFSNFISAHIFDENDVLVSCAFPFESINSILDLIVDDLKCRFLFLLFDDLNYYINNAFLRLLFQKRYDKKYLEYKNNIVKKYDYLLIQQDFNNGFENITNSKIKYFNLPFAGANNVQLFSKKNNYSFCYCGSISKNIRNPDKALYFLNELEKKLPFNLFFNYKGNHKCIKKYKKNKHFVFRENVSKFECDELSSSSDVNIVIGNNKNNNFPSKFIELLSFGNPIIYFYKRDDDLVFKKINNTNTAILFLNENEKASININKVFKFFDNLKFIDYSNILSVWDPNKVAITIENLFQ